MTKRCTKCGEVKDIGEFYLIRGERYNICKKCDCERIRNYRKNNLQLVKELERKTREKNRDKLRERRKRWREKNHEYITYYRKLYYQKHPERIRQSNKRYNDNHRCQVNKRSSKYEKENRIMINGIKYFKQSAPGELKPMIETLIMIRNKKKLYEEVCNGSS